MRKHMKFLIIAIVAALALTVCFPVLALAGSSDGEAGARASKEKACCCEGPRYMHMWRWGPAQLLISNVADALELDEEQEPLARIPGGKQMIAALGGQDSRRRPQDLVASLLAIVFIHSTELVDVDHRRVQLPHPMGIFLPPIDKTSFQSGPVGQSGQRVG